MTATTESTPARSQSHSPLRWRRFNRVLAGLVASAFLTIAGFNLAVDPWGVFGVVDLRDGQATNQRFRKMARVAAEPGRFDAFLVGSSRMGLFDPGDAKALWPQNNWYNLAVFSGDAVDARVMLEALEREGTVIRKAIIGIDLFPFFASHRKDPFAHRHHPRASGEDWGDFASDYLFAQSAVEATLKFAHLAQEPPDITFDFRVSGSFSLPLWDQERATDLRGFIGRQFGALPTRTIEAPLREAAFQELDDLRVWLADHGIEARFFIHPHHRLSAPMRIEPAERARLVARILAITGPIPNFLGHESGYDDALYYDEKHYVPELATQILHAIHAHELRGPLVSGRPIPHPPRRTR